MSDQVYTDDIEVAMEFIHILFKMGLIKFYGQMYEFSEYRWIKSFEKRI